MKKLALAAAAAVLAGCGTVTTTALSPPDSPNLAPIQVYVQEEPVTHKAKKYPRAEVVRKYQNCTTTMAPKLVAAVDNLKSELPPKPPQANLPSMVGNSFMTLPKDMRSSCGTGTCPTGATGRPMGVIPPLGPGKK